jgi:hypothetical protein
MCFYIHPLHCQPKTTTRDMLVYKMLNASYITYNYETPFTYSIIKLNKLVIARPVLKSIDLAVKSKFGYIDTIEQGCIHSFSSIKTAKDAVIFYNRSYRTLEVFEAYIPAGTDYFFNPKDKQIASSRLFITDKKVIF